MVILGILSGSNGLKSWCNEVRLINERLFKSPWFLGAIIVKRANSGKRLNHKWAFSEHFDFFIEKTFWRIFLQHVLKNIDKSPNKFIYYVKYFWINMKILKM